MSVILEDLTNKVKTQVKRELSFENDKLRVNDTEYRPIEILNLVDSGNLLTDTDIKANVEKENLLYLSNNNGVYSEFFKVNGNYVKRFKGLTQDVLLGYTDPSGALQPAMFHTKVDTSKMFDLKGNHKFNIGYYPPFEGSPVNKGYISDSFANLAKKSLAEMNVGYKAEPIEGSVYTLNDIISNYEIYLRLPKTDPLVVGALWNNNGTPVVSAG